MKLTLRKAVAWWEAYQLMGIFDRGDGEPRAKPPSEREAREFHIARKVAGLRPISEWIKTQNARLANEEAKP